MYSEDVDGSDTPEDQQTPNSVPTASAVSASLRNNWQFNKTSEGRSKKSYLAIVAVLAVVLVVAAGLLAFYIGKSGPNTTNSVSQSSVTTTSGSTTTLNATTTIMQQEENGTFASLFQTGSANITQFAAFISQNIRSLNTLGVTYALTSAPNPDLPNQTSNITYREYFENKTIDTVYGKTGSPTVYNEYLFNGTNKIYACTNRPPFKNMECFNGGASEGYWNATYWNLTSALFGAVYPYNMSFVEGSQGEIGGMPCTIVNGVENFSGILEPYGARYTKVASLTTCISDKYYVPLNFTYSSKTVNRDLPSKLDDVILYGNYTEKSITLNVTAAEVTKLPATAS